MAASRQATKQAANMSAKAAAAAKQKASYKHVPHSQKPPHLVAKRNARERRRVQAVNQAFYRLRKCVPIENRNKRVSKVKTLQRAIDYIRRLEVVLEAPQSTTQAATTTTATFRVAIADATNGRLSSSTSAANDANSSKESEQSFASSSSSANLSSSVASLPLSPLALQKRSAQASAARKSAAHYATGQQQQVRHQHQHQQYLQHQHQHQQQHQQAQPASESLQVPLIAAFKQQQDVRLQLQVSQTLSEHFADSFDQSAVPYSPAASLGAQNQNPNQSQQQHYSSPNQLQYVDSSQQQQQQLPHACGYNNRFNSSLAASNVDLTIDTQTLTAAAFAAPTMLQQQQHHYRCLADQPLGLHQHQHQHQPHHQHQSPHHQQLHHSQHSLQPTLAASQYNTASNSSHLQSHLSHHMGTASGHIRHQTQHSEAQFAREIK